MKHKLLSGLSRPWVVMPLVRRRRPRRLVDLEEHVEQRHRRPHRLR